VAVSLKPVANIQTYVTTNVKTPDEADVPRADIFAKDFLLPRALQASRATPVEGAINRIKTKQKITSFNFIGTQG
jgi:hypothetical protein